MRSGKMKALMKKEGAFGAVLTEVPIPEIDKHEVLIKVQAASICGTDVHIYNWDQWARQRIKTPYVFGHEFSGIVEAVGENAGNVKVGEYVSAETHIVCGKCVPCLAGKSHVCTNTAIIGVDTAGCFAEYVKVPADNVWEESRRYGPGDCFYSRTFRKCGSHSTREPASRRNNCSHRMRTDWSYGCCGCKSSRCFSGDSD